MNVQGTATANGVIQTPPTPGSYPAGVTVTTHWRIVRWHISLIGATTVNDVEFQSWNGTAATKTLIETGALSIEGGNDGFPYSESANYGECNPLESLYIASANWNGATVSYDLDLQQIG